MDRSMVLGVACALGLLACGDSTGGEGGGSGGGSATQGSGGATSSSTGGEEHTPHCANKACGECKAANCNAIDNPCNENPECEPAQQSWRFCVCLAAGDAAADQACDDALLAVDAEAGQPIIDCVAENCPACLEIGEDPPAEDCRVTHPECTLCLQEDCNAQVTACTGDAACGETLGTLGSCACSAQLGDGDIDACVATLTDTGTPGADLASCVIGTCGGACGL
jgi:hypothetical protein